VNTTEFTEKRDRMVAEQLEARGIRDSRVLQAMRKVPRERFVDDAMRERAYDDGPLPIGYGQTISQPYMVARMCELGRLSGTERVLEVGAGSGYQTAVLCELGRSIYAVEVRPELARSCQRRLAILGHRNVEIGCFDGTHGWRERAPYDVIIVAAGAPQIPPLLVDQLAEGGRLVVPVGSRQQQRLAVVTRHGARFDVDWNTPCTFVDLIGKFGWGGAGAPKA
jgi:protein-L-isoaspartate(D-aspartate) O-methyltransferase